MQSLERKQLERRVNSAQWQIRSEAAWIRVRLAALHLRRAVKAGFDPNQPRWPDGRWKPAGDADRVRMAGDFTWMGELKREVFLGGERFCIYNFGGRNIIVAGPASKHLGCVQTLHQSAVTHGTLINDNTW